MEVPAGLWSDFLITQEAVSILVQPEDQQSFPIFEGFHHVETESGFKGEFPLGVVRIGWILDFDMALNRNA